MLLQSAYLTSILCLTLLPASVSCSDAFPVGNPPRTDRYGDPLPDGAIFRIGTTRLRTASRHIPRFGNVLLTPDGKFVLSLAGDEQDVCMWETATGREVRHFSAGESHPTFSLSADGTLLAAGGRHEIHLYDIATGKKHRTLDLSPSILAHWLSITFSPDSKSLTVCHWNERDGRENGISRWEIATGKMMGLWEMGPDAPLAVSLDSRLVASMREKDPSHSGDVARLWASRKCHCFLPNPSSKKSSYNYFFLQRIYWVECKR